MKKSRIIASVCWAVTAVALLGLACWFMTGTVFGLGTDGWFSGLSGAISWENLSGPFDVAGRYSVPSGGVDSLYIEWSAGGVTVSPYDGSDIQITELAQRGLHDDETLQYGVSGGMLTIKYRDSKITLRTMPAKRLEILVPRELSGDFERFTVDSSSGWINISDISASVFKAAAVSGDVQLSGINAQSFNAETTSGSLAVDTVSAESIKLHSVTGSVRASGCTASVLSCSTTAGSQSLSGSFDSSDLDSISGSITLDSSVQASSVTANSTSGKIELSGFFDTADIGSVSGGVSVRSGAIPSALKVHTISGNVNIAVPDGNPVSVNHSSVSGRLSSDIPILTQNSAAQITISAVSGSTKITAYE